jgi:hypothetical protein
MEREKWPLNAEVAETPSSDTGSKYWPLADMTPPLGNVCFTPKQT